MSHEDVTRVRAGAANQILAAYDTENLRHSLAQYPRRIYDARQAVNQARKAWKDAELERATAEAEMILLISNETDEKGKAKFSNQEARNAELIRRKATDPKYLELANKVAEAEAALNEAQNQLQQLLDEYQSLRYMSRLIIAEMSVISELADLDEPVEIPVVKEAF